MGPGDWAPDKGLCSCPHCPQTPVTYVHTLPHVLSQTQDLPGLRLCGQHWYMPRGSGATASRDVHVEHTHTHTEFIRSGLREGFTSEHTSTQGHSHRGWDCTVNMHAHMQNACRCAQPPNRSVTGPGWQMLVNTHPCYTCYHPDQSIFVCTHTHTHTPRVIHSPLPW